MDSASGIETPAHEWFWPSRTVERTDSSDEDECEPEEEYDSDSEKSKSDNSNSDTGGDVDDVDDSDERPKKRTKRKKENTATVTEENPDFTVMNIVFVQRRIRLIFPLHILHPQLEEQVDTLMAHLRSKYFYCLWCGVQYKDAADMEDSCPGSSKDLH